MGSPARGLRVGPILGGWLTTDYTWRFVSVGEVVVAVAILGSLRLVAEPARSGPAPQLDWIGSVLSALGLGLIVDAILGASTWGWLDPLVRLDLFAIPPLRAGLQTFPPRTSC